ILSGLILCHSCIARTSVISPASRNTHAPGIHVYRFDESLRNIICDTTSGVPSGMNPNPEGIPSTTAITSAFPCRSNFRTRREKKIGNPQVLLMPSRPLQEGVPACKRRREKLDHQIPLRSESWLTLILHSAGGQQNSNEHTQV